MNYINLYKISIGDRRSEYTTDPLGSQYRVKRTKSYLGLSWSYQLTVF